MNLKESFQNPSIFQSSKNISLELWQEKLNHIQEAITSQEGYPVVQTPLEKAKGIAEDLNLSCELFLKLEFLQVSGSHKIRHFLGKALFSTQKEIKRYAIFSCGNAAISASIIAKAQNIPLYTFVPENVSQNILSILTNNNAKVIQVSRNQNEKGDPCQFLFQKAVENYECTPFTCYSTFDVESIDGIASLGEEIFEVQRKFEHLFVQVGGGGLAHGLFSWFHQNPQTKFFAVQTKGCFPLYLSWLRVIKHLSSLYRLEPHKKWPEEHAIYPSSYMHELEYWYQFAQELKNHLDQNISWEDIFTSLNVPLTWQVATPSSIAEGILDDTPYEGKFLLKYIIESGGLPLVILDEELERVSEVCPSYWNVSYTGLAGLTGLSRMPFLTGPTLCLLTGCMQRENKGPAIFENIWKISSQDSLDKVFKH